MSWIALKMLVGDRAKFFGIVMGLTFAALLITQQGSIFCGLMCRTAGQITDITGADLWVMDANVRYIDDVKPMIENNLYRVRGVEGVEWAVPLYKGNARAKLNSYGIDPQTQQRKKFEVIEQIVLIGLDDSSMIGAPPPERVIAGKLSDLRKPDAVMVDFARLTKLYPGEDWKLLDQPGKVAQFQGFLSRVMGRPDTTPKPMTPARVLSKVHRSRPRDERPSCHHRRRLRGDPDLPVERGDVYHVRAGQAVHPPGTEDPLVRAGQGGARPDSHAGRRGDQAADRTEGAHPG